MKKEFFPPLDATFEAHPQRLASSTCERPSHTASDHFVDVNKTIATCSGRRPGAATRIAFSNMNGAVEFAPAAPYTSSYIRPMAVRPLDHPERWPTPWGFLFSDSGFAMGQLQ